MILAWVEKPGDEIQDKRKTRLNVEIKMTEILKTSVSAECVVSKTTKIIKWLLTTSNPACRHIV